MRHLLHKMSSAHPHSVNTALHTSHKGDTQQTSTYHICTVQTLMCSSEYSVNLITTTNKWCTGHMMYIFIVVPFSAYIVRHQQILWYMSRVTCRFLQACHVRNPQMAARQVVNFRAHSADQSCGVHSERFAWMLSPSTR